MMQNYCIVAFAIVLFISTIQWFVDGRKNYTGPKVETMPQHILTAEQSHEDHGNGHMTWAGVQDSKLEGYGDAGDVGMAAGPKGY